MSDDDKVLEVGPQARLADQVSGVRRVVQTSATPAQEAGVVGVGYLVSSFDLMNVGHLDVIDQAQQLCARLVVGVLTDGEVEVLTGRSPVVPLEERLALVRHVRGISGAVVHGSQEQRALAPDRSFEIDGEDLEGPDGAVRLAPRRRTASDVLLAALASTSPRAVAG
jgi:cytidyltransferase-like protein